MIEDIVGTATTEFVKYLEEVSELSSQITKASVEFAILMERGKTRFSNGWVTSGDLEEVKEAAMTELDKRMEGFDAFVSRKIEAAYTKKSRK